MTDKDALIRLVHRYCNIIHDGTADDFRALWANDCSLVFVSDIYRGQDEIVNGFLASLRKMYKEITLVAEDIDVQIRNENLAIVIFSYHTDCIRREDRRPYGIAGVETQVYVKGEGGWKLSHLHYSKK